MRRIWGGKRGRLLVTGQTTQYNGELDDGYYERGLPKRYTVLTVGQYSGACVFVLDGKTENQSHNCVLDRNTGLMWARYTSAQSASIGPSANGKVKWTGSADDAFRYCAAANAASLGGYSDWRIPNQLELVSLVNSEAPTGVPDAAAFPGWTDDRVWSSTTQPSAAANAHYVYFSVGYIASASKTGGFGYFVCIVRGGL